MNTRKIKVCYDPGNRKQSIIIDRSPVTTWSAAIYRPGTLIPSRPIPNTGYLNINISGKTETLVIGDGAKQYPSYMPIHRADVGTPGHAKAKNSLLFLLAMLRLS